MTENTEQQQQNQPETVKQLTAHDVAHLCREVNMRLAVNKEHWMFNNRDGRRIIDWWRSTNRWWCPSDGTKGTATMNELVALARKKRHSQAFQLYCRKRKK